MVKIEVDTGEMHEFFTKCTKAGDDLKKEFELFLEGIGFDFLRIIQDEIIEKGVVDTRLLLNSFQKGDKNNVWILNEGSVYLEVGTNVEYAKFVNDGHWNDARFIPGVWNSHGRFEYIPNAKQGMMLKAQFIEGRHYWESGLKVIEKMIPKQLEKKMEQWLKKYFG